MQAEQVVTGEHVADERRRPGELPGVRAKPIERAAQRSCCPGRRDGGLGLSPTRRRGRSAARTAPPRSTRRSRSAREPGRHRRRPDAAAARRGWRDGRRRDRCPPRTPPAGPPREPLLGAEIARRQGPLDVSTCNARLAGVPGSGSNPKTATPALSAAIAPLVMLRPPPDSVSFRKMMARTDQIVPFGVEFSALADLGGGRSRT